ncbi:ankyrin repeat domain protein [Talaromyces pinophilus]|uniref:Ankyrin repeat domain protein n=1 Tax=Talaromyces pinophilus TaxID=128442 RepID=A0A478EBX2_TALPI|nr:ankyrin repeat domain protein [Talaromyces pinophilus]
MSNGFSWCATNILELPQVPVNHLQSTLSINQSGEVFGKWRISPLDDISHERYICEVSHPLIEDKLRLALSEKSKHVLLVEPDSQVIERGLVVKLMRRPPKEDGPSIKFSFVGPLKLHAGVQARNIVMNITIGDTENWKQLEEGEIAFDILEETGRELNLTVSGQENASEKYQSRVNSTDPNIASWTELHHASWKCDSMIVAQLVQSKVNLDIRDELGRGALHLAAERGNEVVVGLLLGGGVNPVQRDCNKQTALHRAIWGGSKIVVEQMLQSSCGQALVNIQDELGRTALHCAAERGNQNMVRCLLANGADPDIQCYRGKQTALHVAISRNSEEVVQVLLQGPNGKKSNPGIRDERGRMAIYCAAEQGNLALVELLSHERPFEVEDNTGLTALRWAVKGGNPKVLVEAIERHANS